MLKTLNLDGWETTAWCAPSAVAMVTGASVIHMHSRAAFLRGTSLKEVKELYPAETILLLREQGYGVEWIDMPTRFEKAPTIRKFLNDRTSYEKVMPVMFATDGHIMCAQYGFAGDNWTKKPVPIEDFPKLRRKVYKAWIVVKRD